jgi:hypothetical protein
VQETAGGFEPLCDGDVRDTEGRFGGISSGSPAEAGAGVNSDRLHYRPPFGNRVRTRVCPRQGGPGSGRAVNEMTQDRSSVTLSPLEGRAQVCVGWVWPGEMKKLVVREGERG